MAALRLFIAATALVAHAEWHDHPDSEVVNSEIHDLVPLRVSYPSGYRRRLDEYKTLEQRYGDPTYDAELGKIRITFDYDLLDSDVEQCREEGTTVKPCCAERSSGTQCSPITTACCSSCSTTYACSESDVYTTEWKDLMMNHAEWMDGFLNITIENLNETLVLAENGNLPNYLKYYDWPAGKSFEYEDTDLVVFMTMHRCPVGVAGYAGCKKFDDSGRCLAGFFNWCPSQIDLENKDSPDVIQEDHYLFLHETLHILGCCKPLHFIGSDGQDQGSGGYSSLVNQIEVFTDAGQSKTVNVVISPKVQAVAREQWGCDTLEGGEIEDHSLGSGSHWEARVMGGAVMAYGLLSGEPYLSDLTLAYLEDSGHYIAARAYESGCSRYGDSTGHCSNFTYSGGGRLLEPTAVEFESSWQSSLFSGSDSFDASLIDIKSPGFLRWGRNQGCDFVLNKVSKDNWGSKYFCADAQEAGCTSDNRMSARCDIRQYGSQATVVPSKLSCVASASQSCPTQNSNSNNPGLPPMFQYGELGGDCTTGSCNAGYNNAMDYVPVRIGYWNCLDLKPTSTGSNKNTGANVSLDRGAIFSSLSDDIDKFGGQQHCETCRCFESTLREWGSIKSLEYANYGLCYASNCYKADYLQVGVRSRGGGTDWYGCPEDGGHLYLPGFTGSIACPAAAGFCAYEDITGQYYGETDLLLAWVAVGLLVAVPLLLVLYCCCCPNHAKPCVLRIKLCCGVALARDERVWYARRLAINREKKSVGLMRKLQRAEERLMERSGSTLHMMTASEISVTNHRTWTEEELTWAKEQVSHNRKKGTYVLCKRMLALPLGRRYADKEWQTAEEVMTAAMQIREKDPRVAGLAHAGTVVMARLGRQKGDKTGAMDPKLEENLKFYVEKDLASRDRKAVWCVHTINSIWILAGFIVFILALGTAFDFGVWDGSENAAPFLYGISLIVLIVSCIGSYGSSNLRPTLSLLLYFYICCVCLIYFVLLCIALVLYKDYFYSKMDTEWYSYRSYFPEDYHDLERGDAIDKIHDDTNGIGLWIILLFVVWTIFSLFAGAVCSVIIMTLDSIVLNLFIGLNLVLLSLAGLSLAVGSIAVATQVFIFLPALCIVTSLLLIFLAIFGIYNDIHLSFRTISHHVSFHRWLFDLYEYGAVPLGLLLAGGGVGILSSAGWIEDEVQDLDDNQLADMADAFNQSGDKEELQDFLKATMLFMGIVMLAEALALLLMVPLMCYMDRLHKLREEKLEEYEKDVQFARKQGILKKLPPDGFSIIPALKKRRDQIRNARISDEKKADNDARTAPPDREMCLVGHGGHEVTGPAPAVAPRDASLPPPPTPTVGGPPRPPAMPRGCNNPLNTPQHAASAVEVTASGAFKI